MTTQSTVFVDGVGSVKYSLLRRQNDLFFMIRFRGPACNRMLRSTGKVKIKDVHDVAPELIRLEYRPPGKPAEPNPVFALWDQVIERLRQEMASEGLRDGSVADYCTTL